jgi:hypothetical protein
MEVAAMTGQRRRACEERLHAGDGQRENVAPLRALDDGSIANAVPGIRGWDGRGMPAAGVAG